MIWLLPAAAAIIALYLLKLRRRDVVVPSTLLWRRVIRDVQANAPFQRLRRNLLLILQILAALLLAMALARPYVMRTGGPARSLVLILDTSASMGATDVTPNRLAAAQNLAARVIASMAPQDAAMVIAAGERPAALTGFSGRRSELARAVFQTRSRATTCDMQGALNLAAAVVAPRAEGEIHIFSDGGFPPVAGVNLGRARVVFHRVGKSSNNVAIVAAGYRRDLSQAGVVDVLATLHNFDSRPRTLTVEILSGDRLLDAREVTLPAGGERADVVQIPEPSEPLTLTIQLDVRDDLAADNRAYLLIPPRKTVRVLVVGRTDVFLREAILADDATELAEEPLGEFRGASGYDVVLFNGACPAMLPPGNYVFDGCTANRCPARIAGSVQNGSVIASDASHPILRYVDFAPVRWTSVSLGKAKDWAQEVASCSNGSAIVAGEEGGYRSVWLGFPLDLGHGPFPLTVSYPIFLSNVLRWAARAEDHANQIRTGTAVVLRVPRGAGHIAITKPDGSRSVVPASAGGVVAFDDANEPGIYTARGPMGYVYRFAANLCDYNEANIAPRNPDLPALGPSAASPSRPRDGKPVRIPYELGPALAAALIAVLVLEWWLYHRRIHLG